MDPSWVKFPTKYRAPFFQWFITFHPWKIIGAPDRSRDRARSLPPRVPTHVEEAHVRDHDRVHEVPEIHEEALGDRPWPANGEAVLFGDQPTVK